MEKYILVKEKGHHGKYVALRSFFDSTIVASANSVETTLTSAREQGFDSPVIIYVPKKNSACFV